MMSEYDQTLTTAPGSAPMTRALSIMLIAGQWLMAVGVVAFLIMVGLLLIPNGFYEGLVEKSDFPPDETKFLGRCLTGVIVTLGWFFVIKLLRKVVRAVIHGDPFTPDNVLHLRRIWIIMAVTEVLRMLTAFITRSGADVDGSRLNITVGTWFFIFVIAAISEAFRHGAALRADQELTI